MRNVTVWIRTVLCRFTLWTPVWFGGAVEHLGVRALDGWSLSLEAGLGRSQPVLELQRPQLSSLPWHELVPSTTGPHCHAFPSRRIEMFLDCRSEPFSASSCFCWTFDHSGAKELMWWEKQARKVLEMPSGFVGGGWFFLSTDKMVFGFLSIFKSSWYCLNTYTVS